METTYIAKRPGVVGGKPAIAGTRIKVSQIALGYLGAGNSIAELLRRYPHLTPAQLHSALAYFYDHPEEILQELFDELLAIRSTLPHQELQQLCDQMVPLIIEGLRFAELYDHPAQARAEPGTYLILSERTKSSLRLLKVGATEDVRAALQAYAPPSPATESSKQCSTTTSASETGAIRYAARYAPFAESQSIAELIRNWFAQLAIQE
jgi:uncharacterized protein (DUF433 family)